MTEGNTLSEALDLMLLGMGTVFVFLVVLIIVTSVMSKIIMYFAPDESVILSPTLGNAGSQSNANKNNAIILPVVTAAIHKHRTRNK